MQTNTNSIYAAIITGVAALSGVIIGGILQYLISKRENKQKRAKSLIMAVTLVIEIISMLEELNSEEKLSRLLVHTNSLPHFLQEQLNILYTNLSDYDPQVAMDILWLKQACSNTDLYLKELMKLERTDDSGENYLLTVRLAVIDINSAIKFSRKILVRGFNISSRRVRAELLKNSIFQNMHYERNYIAKKLMEHGFKSMNPNNAMQPTRS